MIFNSLIPLPFYAPLFYNVVFALVIVVALKLQLKGFTIQFNRQKEYASLFLLLVVLLYMGLRPISYVFGDMGMYNHVFNHYLNGGNVLSGGDYLWQLFMKFSAGIMSAENFFLVCAVLYCVPLYVAVKKWLPSNQFLLLLMIIASFSFWSYGTNGIRNGIASSLFIWALAIDKKSIRYAIFLLSFSVHGSIIIPIAAYVLTMFYKNPYHYLTGWLLAIPLSLVLGGFWESLFAGLGFGGERTNYLTDTTTAEQFASTGFRWDFLVYSASAVYAGYYFIVKKNFKDPLYIQLFNIYVTANAFWIFIIRASFSNRFAYLSWFLMAFIIFYPFLKERFFTKQQKVLGYTMLGYVGFTYFMFLIGKI